MERFMRRIALLSLALMPGASLLAQRQGGPPSFQRPGGSPPAQQYTIEQATSDRAQLHTIAFSGLAFLTGDFGASTFLPPGKVNDFFGFQYMRDIDLHAKGHNPMFLDRVAGNVLHTLDATQKQRFRALAAEQAPQLQALAEARLPLISAFHRQLQGTPPTGSTGLNKEAVVHYVGDLFARDAELSYRRAAVMGAVATSLSAEQKAYLAAMKFGDFTSWPEVDVRSELGQPPRGDRPTPSAGERPAPPPGDRPGQRGADRPSQLLNVAYMTYASEFFSWYAGSVDADTYFCPERHGTYFGGFYMKDMPAMGKGDFDISLTRTGEGGREFLERVLTADQRVHITSIVEKQRQALAAAVVVRRQIATELRKFLAGKTPDHDTVIALGRRYGELDGEMSWYYATAFAAVNGTLTAAQRQAMLKLRDLDGYTSAPAYLFSQPLPAAPRAMNTDAFFLPRRVE